MKFSWKHFLKFAGMILLMTGIVSESTARSMDDISQRRIIGFSPSGDYFAFEEFGKNPGSGNAYANIYVINTVRNQWVKGSPFRVKPSEGIRTRRRVRKRVERKAARMLRRLRIQRKRVRILASNPITELSSNKMRIKVNPRVSITPVSRPMIFSIQAFRIRRPNHCRRLTGRNEVKGLLIRVKREGGRWKQLHKDRHIPKSRGCPISYAISDVIQLKKPSSRGAVYALIYTIIRKGKHGLERSFIGGGYHDDGDRRDPNYYTDNDQYSDYDTPYYYDNANNQESNAGSYRDNDDNDQYSDAGNDRYSDNRSSNNSSNRNDDPYSDNYDRPNDSSRNSSDRDDDYGYSYKRSKQKRR